jgi:hypothetical protein
MRPTTSRSASSSSTSRPFRIAGTLGRLADLLGHEGCVVQHHGEQIVEVVRGAAGQPAEALQPLRLVGGEFVAFALPLPGTLRHQDIERLAQQVGAGLAEHVLGGGVQERDPAGTVHPDDGIGGGFDQRV